jgi:hypothetical protein
VQSVGRAVGKTRFKRIEELQSGHIGVSVSVGNVISFRSWTALTLPQLICDLLYEFVRCLTAINHSEQCHLANSGLYALPPANAVKVRKSLSRFATPAPVG